MPTGTLANHLAIRALAGERRRVIVQDVSHVYNDTGDGCQVLSGLTLIPLAPGPGDVHVGRCRSGADPHRVGPRRQRASARSRSSRRCAAARASCSTAPR